MMMLGRHDFWSTCQNKEEEKKILVPQENVLCYWKLGDSDNFELVLPCRTDKLVLKTVGSIILKSCHDSYQ
jgi:hypothetical protein